MPCQLEQPRQEDPAKNWPTVNVINAITGGHDGLKLWESTERQKFEEAITFPEEDTKEIQLPHNDVVVVSLNIIIMMYVIS